MEFNKSLVALVLLTTLLPLGNSVRLIPTPIGKQDSPVISG